MVRAAGLTVKLQQYETISLQADSDLTGTVVRDVCVSTINTIESVYNNLYVASPEIEPCN